MLLRAGMVAFGVLAGSVMQAAESDAPLSNTSQELREIGKEQGSSTQESSLGNLKQALPPMQMPLPSLISPETPATKKGELNGKKNKEASKNWLIDGVNKLEKENKIKAAGGTETSSRAELTESTNSTEKEEEPDSLLKLYTGQKNQAEAEAKERTPPTSVQNNAFTPFLQNWLSDPRGQSSDKLFAESISRKNGGVGADFQSPVAGQSTGSADVGVLGVPERQNAVRVESNLAPATNPYLQQLEARALPDLDLRGSQSLTIPSIKIERQVEPLVPNPRPEASKQKVPAPARSEDQKYFPQLKKF